MVILISISLIIYCAYLRPIAVNIFSAIVECNDLEFFFFGTSEEMFRFINISFPFCVFGSWNSVFRVTIGTLELYDY